MYRLEYGCSSAELLPLAFATQFQGMAQEGFARTGELVRFLRENLHRPVSLTQMHITSAELRDVAATELFSEFCAALTQQPSTKLPYTAFAESNAKVEDICLVDIGSHALCDRFGGALPVSMTFDYMQGYSHDTAYDLNKALPVLQAHPRVRLARESMGSRQVINATPPDAPLMICDVPYYNRSSGHNQFIPFKFTPTAEEALLIQQMVAAHTHVDEFQAVFRLDLLGLRAAGAAYGADYHDRREVSEPDDGFDD